MNGSVAIALSDEDLLGLARSGTDGFDEYVHNNPLLLTPASVERLAELVRHRVRVDVEEALMLAESALAIAERLGDVPSLGRGSRAKANALWFKGDCRTAVDYFDRAAQYFESAGLSAEVGRTLSSSIQALLLIGAYDRAEAAATAARAIFLATGDEWRRVRVELNIANIHHRQDRFAEALAVYETAYAELSKYKDTEGLGVALHNMAVCLIMLNDFDRALGCYDRVRELCRANSMPLLELQADYNVAYLHFLRGDYRNAIEGLSRVRVRSGENGDSYHSALCDLDEAEIYLELNLVEEASRMAEDAKRQFEKLGMNFEAGRSTANLAVARHRLRETAQAVTFFEEARTVFERERNQAWLALIDLYQAMVLCEDGKLDQARERCERALAFFRAASLIRREIVCELLLARLLLETGRVADCRVLCNAVLDRLREGAAPLLAFRAHLLLGHVEKVSGDWQAAYLSYTKARSELETLRGNLQGEELKISFVQDKIDVYESLVEVCLDARSTVGPDEIFRIIEQAKSRNLAELVSARDRRLEWTQLGGGAETLRAIKGELQWLYHRIELEQTSREAISLDRIGALRESARLKEDEFLRLIRKHNLTSGGLEPADRPAHAEATDLRDALQRDALIVEYFQTSSDFLAVVSNGAEFEVVRLGSVGRVSSHIRMLEFQLSKFRLDATYSSAFGDSLIRATQSRLGELFDDLVRPLLPLLNRDHIVVVPHGVLHYIPFHALFDGTHYLIDRFTISYAPSAWIYAMCHQKSVNTAGPSLLMGVQDENAPFIEAEIHSAAEVLPQAQVYIGQAATTEVLRSVGPGCRLIHVATHGLFRKDNAMFSSVRLADSFLNFYDLFELKLPVGLLTLSGCGTGLSVVAPGDELLGLTRGLLSAGAQTLLLSLWDVHDRTTAGFMASFYTHLRNSGSKAGALRTAMLETRSVHPHPYFWAPFFLVGKVLGRQNI